ncbi:MAG: hypothetical protein ACK5X3_23785 [Pseudomonadota bacterium]|jgi:hypothetical protein
MIDWDKPIETVGGRKAKLLSCVMPVGGDYSSGRAVYVEAPPGAVFGDVFLVDEKGFRCDDSGREEPGQIIRNVRVKREGWVHVRRGTSLLGDYRIFSTETDARNAASFSEQVVRMEWEE